jgi:hypothetical protein
LLKKDQLWLALHKGLPLELLRLGLLRGWQVGDGRCSLVKEGHPEKICNQISDAVLDTLDLDPCSKVACETATKDNIIKFEFDEVMRKAF